MSKWKWLLRQFSKKLWLRATIYCFGGVVTAFLAPFISPFVPEEFSYQLESDAVYDILNIMANSMLVVTTFSLSVMVAANTAVNSNATPRAARLILEDSTAQNALAVFIGSFLFSLVGIIALKMSVYGASGRVILLAVTVVVIISMITVLLRWINYLSKIGRVTDTINMVENATEKAIARWIKRPHLGANKLVDYKPKKSHSAIRHSKIGYIQNIDIESISQVSDDFGVKIYLQVLPGKFNDSITDLIFTSKKLDEKAVKKLQNAISIGSERDFGQDPRFGMIVLSEIGSRALSPGINDPGSAIDIIGTAVSLLRPWIEKLPLEVEVKYKNIYAPDLRMKDIFQDVFNPIARDGAGFTEVGVRLQKALKALSEGSENEVQDLAKSVSGIAMKRANSALEIKEDKEFLKRYIL